MKSPTSLICCLALLFTFPVWAGEPTYAERLGWPAGSRVLMLHADDLGMSMASNDATIATFEAGTVTSCSIMMPCSWVPQFATWLKAHPEVCAGVHLTLTSEWDPYRWGPVAGRTVVPGLVDASGYMHDNVAAVIAHATPDEVETEIRAQIALAEKMGIRLTHIDSHMGTLYASPAFFERYLKVAIEKQLPLLIAGGHLTIARAQEGEALVEALQGAAKTAWAGGLPVLDDIDTRSYTWEGLDKKAAYLDAIRTLKPGVTWLNAHPTMPSDEGKTITDNREKIFGDYLSLVDPELKKVIADEGIILTSWQELKARRDKVGAKE